MMRPRAPHGARSPPDALSCVPMASRRLPCCASRPLARRSLYEGGGPIGVSLPAHRPSLRRSPKHRCFSHISEGDGVVSPYAVNLGGYSDP